MPPEMLHPRCLNCLTLVLTLEKTHMSIEYPGQNVIVLILYQESKTTEVTWVLGFHEE